MASDLEKAQLMSALARGKGNWGEKYDRLEHFKRFQNLKEMIKELSRIGWVLVHAKSNYTGISLDSHHKKEIIAFIEKNMPYLKGEIK